MHMLAAPLSTLANNVQIYGEDTESASPQFIIKTLIVRGAVVYDRVSGEWFAFDRTGEMLRDGFPSYISLIGHMGMRSSPIRYTGRDGDLCIIPANAFFDPPILEIARKVNVLNFVSNALEQNVNALKQATAIMYTDPALDSQIERAEQDRLNGKSTVHIQTKVGDDVQIVPFGANAQSHITEFMNVWVQTLEELDACTGRVKVGEKTERRTDDEIAVIENSSCSSIDTIIDTFNRYAAWYGLRARAERGTELRRTREQPSDDSSDSDNAEEQENGEDV